MRCLQPLKLWLTPFGHLPREWRNGVTGSIPDCYLVSHLCSPGYLPPALTWWYLTTWPLIDTNGIPYLKVQILAVRKDFEWIQWYQSCPLTPISVIGLIQEKKSTLVYCTVNTNDNQKNLLWVTIFFKRPISLSSILKKKPIMSKNFFQTTNIFVFNSKM